MFFSRSVLEQVFFKQIYKYTNVSNLFFVWLNVSIPWMKKFILHMKEVVFNVLLQKELINWDNLHPVFSKNVIYIAYCLSCLKQGVGSTVDWKPWLRDYKLHMKKKIALATLLAMLLMVVVTQIILQNILNSLSLTSYKIFC